MRHGRRQLAAGFAATACAALAWLCAPGGEAVAQSPAADAAKVSAWSTGGASATAKPSAADGKPAAAAPAGGVMPYWQAPALPTAVIQGGAIPAGWQPQAVPYQGIGPDGRPITMYFAPTYVFTYQSGPPVLAVPQVNRAAAGVNRPGVAGQPYVPPWNYQTSGAAPAATTLPPATVARYAPQPYQFPPNSRALTGTPLAPPGPLPGPPASPPQAWGVAPPALPSQTAASLAPPPQQWVPSDVPPPPGVAQQMPAQPPLSPPVQPQQPPPNQWTGVAAPVAAGVAGVAAGAAIASAPAAQPSGPLPPPVAPIPSATGPQPIVAQPVSSGGLAPPVQSAAPAGSAANTHQWKVVAVYDGDTVTCIDENNQQQKIRLAEIDAPEAKQDFGQVSRQALASMVFGKTITVVDDGKDRYGRWIGHLYADGVDVNRQMVATGMAWHYSAYSKDQSLAALQAQARAQKLGLWSQPNPIPPSEFRRPATKKSA